MSDRSSTLAVRIGALALIALGTVVMGGWVLGIGIVTSVLPGLATMKPMTALCFLVSGLSLELSLRSRGSSARGVAQALGAAVALVGALTVIEYRLGWDGGFDALLFSAESPDLGGPYPLRMSEMTAVAFLLSGLALVAAPSSVARTWIQSLSVAVLTISLTAIVGYVYGVDALYAVDPFSSVALHTALSFAVLAMCTLWLRPNDGLVALLRSDTVGGTTARRYVPLMIGIPLVLGWLQLVGVQTSVVEQEFGTALVSVATVLLLAGLVWNYADWLDHGELHRRELEQQLLRSQRMESVGRLAGGIAHDFNNVLTIVTSTAGVMRQDARDEASRADLQIILDAAGKAAAITKQLLALGRRQVLHPEVMNLNDIVRGNDEIIRRLAPESVASTLRLADDLGNVLIDRGKLEQVLVNLIMNAVDAMPDGGTLIVETRNADLDEAYASRHAEVQPGPHVVLLVSDTGVGMDKATLQQIFEPFFTTKAPDKGTGLGLATAYGLVRQSGGHVWVYSEPGHGTTFKIYLPRVDLEARRIKPRASPSVMAEGTGTVLVVDDEEALQKVVARVLERAGYAVHTASNGAHALRVAAEHDGPIHLVLTDVMMPEMGAGELTTQLRAMRPEVRFLYMSGYADERILHEVGQGGSEGVLEKPFSPEEILRRVSEALADPAEKAQGET